MGLLLLMMRFLWLLRAGWVKRVVFVVATIRPSSVVVDDVIVEAIIIIIIDVVNIVIVRIVTSITSNIIVSSIIVQVIITCVVQLRIIFFIGIMVPIFIPLSIWLDTHGGL